MTYNPDIHHRRSIRLKGFDYASANAYFVTICVQGRECLFGEIVDGKMLPNEAGRMVAGVWHELPERFPNVEIDEFIVMPNHVHGIIVINDIVGHKGAMNSKGAMNCAPTGGNGTVSVGARFIAPDVVIAPKTSVAPPLGEIMRVFKAVSTRLIRRDFNAGFSWQRNYYERIIRGDDELSAIREYIRYNPVQWECDEENPVVATP